ncbi:MAG: hypothetical protein K2N05_08210 [Muribaculaceae bacterium]|nr:hypothetical protein [Muribaculaceae bacterium]
MKNFLSWAFVASMIVVASCSDDKPSPDNPNPDPTPSKQSHGAFILNQGQDYNKIEGSLNYIDLSTLSVSKDIFTEVNHRSLGTTPQCGICYGNKIYIGVYGSNTIEILDADSYQSIKQIKLDSSTGTEPRSMVKYDGKILISMFDGYVARLDTTSLEIESKVKVGPNPEKMAIYKGKLYVPNSDGNNWMVGYGTTASIIDLATFSVESTVNVPLNPENFMVSNDRLFLLSRGNYRMVPSNLYEIDPEIAQLQKKDPEAGYSLIASATIATPAEEHIYLIDAPYKQNEISISYSKYNTKTSKLEKWNPTDISYPNQIAVEPYSGNVIVTSYILDGIFPSYTAPGYAVVYDKDESIIKKFDIGSGPAAIFFSEK